jgi:solute carrier family 25 protein 33/36
VSCALLSPLEVVKTRLQSSLVTTNRLPPHRLAAQIVRMEGFRGLYRGLFPHLLGVGPSRAFYFGSYSMMKHALGEGAGGGGLSGPPLHLLASTIASLVSCTIMSPVWVIKTRLQLQATPPEPMLDMARRLYSGGDSRTVISLPHEPYRGVADAFARVHREEGWRAFYRGLSASYLGVIETAVQFTMYSELKAYVIESRSAHLRAALESGDAVSGLTPNSTGADIRREAYSDGVAFATSAAAKLLAAVATYPHEVLRTRLREARGSSHPGIVETGLAIYRVEGLRGLYGGMSVHLLRTVPNAAIMIMIVERFTGGEV